MVYLEVMKELDRSAERIHQRLNRTVTALNAGHVPYAVIGGNAVDLWLKSAGGEGVSTRDVDILLRRNDTGNATHVLKDVGFIRRDLFRRPMFLDGPNATAREAVHVVFANEKYNNESILPAPDVEEFEEIGGARVITLEALMKMKLTAFRSRDRTHLIELLKVGVIDSSTIDKLPESLKGRFQEVLDEFESTVEDWERE